MARRTENRPAPVARAVFLNLPYHPSYERLFVAYITGITTLGLAPRTALELGVAYAHAHHNRGRHEWFVFDKKSYCLQKSLSDLNGTDIFIHGGTVEGVLRGLSDCFVKVSGPPPIAETKRIYRELRRAQPSVLRRVGAKTIFSPRVFKELALMARVLTTRMRSKNH